MFPAYVYAGSTKDITARANHSVGDGDIAASLEIPARAECAAADVDCAKSIKGPADDLQFEIYKTFDALLKSKSAG